MNAGAQRGQTLPVWAFGTLSLLLVFFFVLNYANVIYYQVRAQSAADAAAQGILSIQATQWNQQTMILHASTIEEYRIRNLIQGMILAIHGVGGCTPPPDSGNPYDCDAVYASLQQSYVAAVNRYTQDVKLMQRVSTPTQAQVIAEMQSLLSAYSNPANCNTSSGGDCAFTYTLINPEPRPTTYLGNVQADAYDLLRGGGGTSQSTAKVDLTPLQAEVVACANIQPLFGTFFHLNDTQPFVAVGRAAATDIMVMQEWMDPGIQSNPPQYGGSGAPFQPTEYPEGTGIFTPNNNYPNDYDYYDIDYGGNPMTAQPRHGDYVGLIQNDELSEWLGWWSSIPILPYSGTLTPVTDFACKS